MDIGIFGGTFDPIHLGHLTVAREVREKLELDEVIFIPAGQPWLKADRPVSPAKQRLEMVALAIADIPYFGLSTIDVERPGPTYTVDTIADLRDDLGMEVKFFFLLGGDALYELPQWREPSRLVQMCQLVAFNRPDAALPSFDWLESAIPGVSQHITLVEVSQVEISASQIRQRLARGDSLEGLVPPAVEKYILEKGLYKD